MTEAFESTSMFGEDEEAPPRVPLAPLIDIVFLLIGFFMLAAQIVDDERDLEVRLPDVAHAGDALESPGDLIVNIREGGEITVAGEAVSLLDLPDVLAARFGAGLDAGVRPNVVIRADKAEQFRRLDEVLEACEAVGVTDVVLRALPPRGGR